MKKNKQEFHQHGNARVNMQPEEIKSTKRVALWDYILPKHASHHILK